MQINDRVFPYFQPIVDISKNCIAGYEVLARSLDNHGNVISIGSIFSDESVDEEVRIKLDRNIRKKALDIYSLSSQKFRLNINISPLWIEKYGFNHQLPTLEMIKGFDINPQNIVIEITEYPGNEAHLLRAVQLYREHGIKIALDDVGSGFSQLDRIIAIQPDILKIDMMLMKKALNDPTSKSVLSCLTKLSDQTGAEIIFEGTETLEEFNLALECGVKYIQGYLFYHPGKNFLNQHRMNEQINSWIHDYSQQKKKSIIKNLEKEKSIKATIQRLKKSIEMQGNLQIPHQFNFFKNCKFYICNQAGTQISPNYEISNYQVIEKDEYIGMNWKWRPYFYQMYTLFHNDRDEVLFSDVYYDVNTGQPCKTAGTIFSDNQLLFVDFFH